MCFLVSNLLRNLLTCFFAVFYNYPEHVLTWEGYGNWRVSSCVCVCVILNS